MASVHGEHFALSVEAIYTLLAGDGAAPLDDGSGVGAVGYTDTLQLHMDVSAHVLPELALVGQLRYLPYHGPYLVGLDVTAADGQTRVGGELALDVVGLQHAWAVLAGVHLTFGSFNMRLAAGWGSLFLQDLGLVVPMSFLQVDFDIYFGLQLW